MKMNVHVIVEVGQAGAGGGTHRHRPTHRGCRGGLTLVRTHHTWDEDDKYTVHHIVHCRIRPTLEEITYIFCRLQYHIVCKDVFNCLIWFCAILFLRENNNEEQERKGLPLPWSGGGGSGLAPMNRFRLPMMVRPVLLPSLEVVCGRQRSVPCLICLFHSCQTLDNHAVFCKLYTYSFLRRP